MGSCRPKTPLANSPKGPTVALRIISGPHEGEEYVFDSHNTLVIGRAPDAQWQMHKDPYFSRYHFRIEVNPPTCRLEDLRSTNGTQVNGARVEAVALQDGDHIECGETVFEVAISQPDDAAATLVLPSSPGTEETIERVLPAARPDRVGDFLIDRELARGAMGVVYHAVQQGTGREAAVKLIQPAVAARPEAKQLFLREVTLLGGLRHPRIVEYLSHGLHEGHMFLAMEYLPVVEAQELFASQSRPKQLRLAVSIVGRVLEALQFAHERGIVHRDVKPSNILCYRHQDGLRVKLADFGLAKNYEEAGFSSVSRDNQVRGTLDFMAPEQLINCRYVRPPCDIYAAGVCLYYFLSFRLPYCLDDQPSAIAQILNTAPKPLSEQVPDLPLELTAIVDRALAREPDARYASAEEMRQALVAIAQLR